MSIKLFKFDSNIFRRFNDRFFKVLAIDVMADGLPPMFNKDGEPRFSFYWQNNPTWFKSFDEDLLTLEERVDKAILEQLPTSLDAQTILSLSSASDPLTTLDDKCFTLSSSFVSDLCCGLIDICCAVFLVLQVTSLGGHW